MDNVQNQDELALVACFRLTLNLRWPVSGYSPEDMMVAMVEHLEPLIAKENILLIEGSSPDMPGASVVIPRCAAMENIPPNSPEKAIEAQEAGLSVNIARKINEGICVSCDGELEPGEPNPCEDCVTFKAAEEALNAEERNG